MSRGRQRKGGEVPPTPTPAAALVPAAAVLAVEVDPADSTGGRKRITEAGVALVEQWAGAGATKRAIAARLRISDDSLRRIADRQPEVAQALAAGGMVHESLLVDKLTEAAKQGGRDGIIAAIFLLKARHGWREGEGRDGAAVTTNVQVINLPAAMTPEQYLATLDTTAGRPSGGGE